MWINLREWGRGYQVSGDESPVIASSQGLLGRNDAMSPWLPVVQGAHKGRPYAMSFFVGATLVGALYQHTPVRFIH